jgi:hypothetical protein
MTLTCDKHFQQSNKIKNEYTKSVSFLYTNNEHAEKEIRKTFTFTIDSRKIEYLAINLTKEVKDLCNETYKTHMKEIEEGARWKYYENGCMTEIGLQIQCNFH